MFSGYSVGDRDPRRGGVRTNTHIKNSESLYRYFIPFS